MHLLQKHCKTRFLESSILKKGYGALPVTTQAPKTLFWANKLLFLAKNAVFFGDGGPDTLDYLLQNLAKHPFFESSTLIIGYGALQLTTQAPKTLF